MLSNRKLTIVNGVLDGGESRNDTLIRLISTCPYAFV